MELKINYGFEFKIFFKYFLELKKKIDFEFRIFLELKWIKKINVNIFGIDIENENKYEIYFGF